MQKEPEDYLLSYNDILSIKNSPTDRFRTESINSVNVGMYLTLFRRLDNEKQSNIAILLSSITGKLANEQKTPNVKNFEIIDSIYDQEVEPIDERINNSMKL